MGSGCMGRHSRPTDSSIGARDVESRLLHAMAELGRLSFNTRYRGDGKISVLLNRITEIRMRIRGSVGSVMRRQEKSICSDCKKTIGEIADKILRQ